MLVLIVAHFFHPVDSFAVELFLNGDVSHGRGRRRAMPMLFAGREPDDVAGTDFFNSTAPFLSAPATVGHDQGLAERMRVPRGARTRFKGNLRADGASGSTRLEQRINAYRAGEPIRRTFAGRL